MRTLIPDGLLVAQDLLVLVTHPLAAVGGVDHGDLLHGVHQLHLARQRELVVQLRPDLRRVGGVKCVGSVVRQYLQRQDTARK